MVCVSVCVREFAWGINCIDADALLPAWLKEARCISAAWCAFRTKVMCWSWGETPEKARRQVTIDESAGVVRSVHGSRSHLIQRGALAYPWPDGVEREQVPVTPW